MFCKNCGRDLTRTTSGNYCSMCGIYQHQTVYVVDRTPVEFSYERLVELPENPLTDFFKKVQEIETPVDWQTQLKAARCAKKLRDFVKEQKDLPEDISEMINEKFWELI